MRAAIETTGEGVCGRELVVARRPGSLDLSSPPTGATPDDLVARWLAGKRPDTVRAYRGDLEAFRKWVAQRTVGEPSIDDALGAMFGAHPTALYLLAEDYRQAMHTSGLAPSSINRRLSTLRSVMKLARRLGLTTNTLDVEGVAQETRKQTRGPSAAEANTMLRAAQSRRNPIQAARDYLLMRLLLDLGLRRREASTLDLRHVDLEGERPTVAILGKCRGEREPLTIPPQTADAIRAWLGVRPEAAGDGPDAPLLCALRPEHLGRRLSPGAIYDLVRGLGRLAGVSAAAARPHGLRHTASTIGARCAGGDVFRLVKFTRHKGIATAQRYVDGDRDDQGTLARAVAAAVDAAG